MSLPHKDLYTLHHLHPPAFQNGNVPLSPPSPSLFSLPTPFPHTAAHWRTRDMQQFLPMCYVMALGASCDMINNLKSFWRTESWQLEGMRANPGDIFLYHRPTGNLFSVRRMSAIWLSERLIVQYFRTLPCLLWKHHIFTESRCLYLENLILWHSLRLCQLPITWNHLGREPQLRIV